MAVSSPMFPASLVAADVVSSLPDGFTIRPMEKADLGRGFVDCLRELAWVGEPKAEQLERRYDDMDSQGKGPYYYVVVEHPQL